MEFLERIIDSITDPIFVKDSQHRLVFVNDAECKLTGRGRDQLLGRTDYDFFPREEVDVFWAKDDEVLRTGNEDINEEEITTADGGLRRIVTKKTLYRDRDGRSFIVGIIRDVTDRARAESEVRRLAEHMERLVLERTTQLEATNRALERDIGDRIRAEQALSAETERLRVTLGSIADGVIATDLDSRIQIMNGVAEQLTGARSAEAVGRPLTEVFRVEHEEGRASTPGPANALPADGRTEPLVLTSSAGTAQVIEASAAPIRDSAGSILGRVIVFRDITERRKIDEHLANAQRLGALGLLAAGIAHDFNNLLTAIFGNIELAARDMAKESEGAHSLRAAHELLGRARALTRQLMTFAKGGEPVTKIASVARLLDRSVPFCLTGSSCICDVDSAGDLWPCSIDENQIADAINNIVLNARQAMDEGGSLRITARNTTLDKPAGIPLPTGAYVQITIADTGPGMSAETLAHAFDPFFTTRPDGNGLGLPTAFSIVKRHGGHLAIESALGKGTKVTIFLPATPGHSLSPIDSAHSEDRTIHGRILVVDDEPSLRRLLETVLRDAGCDVETVGSGSEAVQTYHRALQEKRGFHVVILDLTVPGDMNGVETLRQLRNRDPKVRAIASSGYFDHPVMANPCQFGFEAALPKPYTSVQVVETVFAALYK
jgi:PAS domain S-box-containing protein